MLFTFFVYLQYHRGRSPATWRRKKWIFGVLGVHNLQKRPVLRLVRKRQTTVLSDQWGAYRGALAALGYRQQHLALIEWTHWLGNVHRNGTLGRLLRDIRKQYKV